MSDDLKKWKPAEYSPGKKTKSLSMIHWEIVNGKQFPYWKADPDPAPIIRQDGTVVHCIQR